MSNDLNMIKVQDKLACVIDKMEFITDAICTWDINGIGFSDAHKSGFYLIASSLILDLKEISTIINDKRV